MIKAVLWLFLNNSWLYFDVKFLWRLRLWRDTRCRRRRGKGSRVYTEFQWDKELGHALFSANAKIRRQSSKYLGSWMEHDEEVAIKIKRRIGQVVASSDLWRIWCSTIHYGLHLLTSNVMYALFYTSKGFKLYIQPEKHVLAFEKHAS